MKRGNKVDMKPKRQAAAVQKKKGKEGWGKNEANYGKRSKIQP